MADREELNVCFSVELENSDDGLWRARVSAAPDMQINGDSRSEALLRAKAFALRQMAERVDEETGP